MECMYIREKDLHEMTSEEIVDDLARPDNDGFLASPLHRIMLDELTFRQIKNLTGAIDSFSNSSDKSSKKLLWLTWILIILTIALTVMTFVMIKNGQKETLSSNNISLNAQFFTPTNIGIAGTIESGKPVLLKNKGIYSDAELDNYLGTFDLIQNSYDEKLLKETDFCDSFSSYITNASKNQEVQKYIADSQKINSQFFTSVPYLYNKVQSSKSENCH